MIERIDAEMKNFKERGEVIGGLIQGDEEEIIAISAQVDGGVAGRLD